MNWSHVPLPPTTSEILFKNIAQKVILDDNFTNVIIIIKKTKNLCAFFSLKKHNNVFPKPLIF